MIQSFFTDTTKTRKLFKIYKTRNFIYNNFIHSTSRCKQPFEAVHVLPINRSNRLEHGSLDLITRTK